MQPDNNNNNNNNDDDVIDKSKIDDFDPNIPTDNYQQAFLKQFIPHNISPTSAKDILIPELSNTLQLTDPERYQDQLHSLMLEATNKNIDPNNVYVTFKTASTTLEKLANHIATSKGSLTPEVFSNKVMQYWLNFYRNPEVGKKYRNEENNKVIYIPLITLLGLINHCKSLEPSSAEKEEFTQK